jgi:hypothetical protein
MPFDDNQFDYVVLWSVLEFTSRPEAMLEEASRVAEKGILLGFLNKFSLYYLMNVRKSTGTMSRAKLLNPFSASGMLRNATGSPLSLARSVLPGPLATWRENFLMKRVNDQLYPSWLGAFSALRVDMKPYRPLTPLLLWRSEKKMNKAGCGSGATCRNIE